MRGFRVWSDYWKKYATEAELYMDGSIDAIFEDDGGVPHHENTDLVVEFKTGIKDKNGEEIYEGDIVFFFTEHFDKATGGFDGEDEHNATVEWFDNGFAFMDKVPYDPNIECEVIGNIHENPELLEEEDE